MHKKQPRHLVRLPKRAFLIVETLDFEILCYITANPNVHISRINKKYKADCRNRLSALADNNLIVNRSEATDKAVAIFEEYSATKSGKTESENYLVKKRQKTINYFMDKWIDFLALAVAAIALIVSIIALSQT